MSILQNHHNYSQNETLQYKQINLITPHVLYGGLESLLAETNYMLSSGDMLSDEVMRICFLQHPVLVIRARASKERLHCVSNIRSFMLAHATLKSEDQLPVILLDRPTTEAISLLVNTDLVTTPLLYSLRSPQPVGRVHENFKKNRGDELNALFKPGKETKVALAHQTGYALNTIFPLPCKSRTHKE